MQTNSGQCRHRGWLLAAAALMGCLPAAAPCAAAMHTESVVYRQGGVELEGYLAYSEAVKAPMPAVIVVHDWMGLGDFAKAKARDLAAMGYLAFAADIYGKGVRPAGMPEAAKLATQYKADRKLLRARVLAAYDLVRQLARVDPKRVAAIGYCFGGTTVLELARAGAEVAGVVSIHGGLGSPTPDDARNIKGKVLALHGADDPNVPPSEVAGFEDEMRKAGVDWQLVKYGGAVHAFTNPEAGHDNSKGAAYNEKADRRSWEALKQFFGEIFR
jgi:dienelactone hydrolase